MTGRRQWLVWGAVTYVAIMAVVSVSLVLLYGAARDRLDAALGERLTAVAVTATYLADGDSIMVWSFDPAPTMEFAWLSSRLEQIRRQNDLASITLCDPEQRVLISTARHLERGEFNVFSQLNQEATDLALSGLPAQSELYRTGEYYQKSAHAPVFTADGTIAGLLTVEGNADFFDSLTTLRTGALVTVVLVLVFLLITGMILLQLNRVMQRYRALALRQENLAAMGRMTAGIAHEIRNPLGIIRGAGQHLQRRLTEAGIEDEVAGFIPGEVDRLDQILNGYLTFGTDSPSPDEPCDLVQIVRRSISTLAREFTEIGITSTLVQAPPSAEIKGDPRRLQQVLLNLMLNARDAMPNGGEITLAVESADSTFRLTIIDQGTGLAGGDPEQLFVPFETTREKGSGLGLALSRRIVTDHGGMIQLSNRTDGKGAIAVVELPR